MDALSVKSRFSAMGTVVEQLVNGSKAKAARAAAMAQAEVERLEGLLSAYRPSSDVAALNRNAGGAWVRVSAETLEVLQAAQFYASASDGAFDPTVGPVVQLWRAGADEGKVPPPGAVAAALAVQGYRGLMLDVPTSSARLAHPDQRIDPGAIGKGYTADRVREAYRAAGVSSAFINLGGNVVGLGTKPDGSPWSVGIRHPRRADQALIGVVTIVDKAVVTSGDYFRYFMSSDGLRCHHIIDPRTGGPSDSGLMSVTVVAESATAADALSTAAFVMGLSAGSRFIRSFAGTDAVFITGDGSTHVTAGLLGNYRAV